MIVKAILKNFEPDRDEWFRIWKCTAAPCWMPYIREEEDGEAMRGETVCKIADYCCKRCDKFNKCMTED